jgi:hypothetical protein
MPHWTGVSRIGEVGCFASIRTSSAPPCLPGVDAVLTRHQAKMAAGNGVISMGLVILASNEFILTRPGAPHGLLLLSQGARRLILVRVLHMFTFRRNDYAPSAVPKSNSRFRPDAAHLSSFRIRAARRRRFGQMQYRPHGTNTRFWPGLQRLHGPLNDAQLDGLGYR